MLEIDETPRRQFYPLIRYPTDEGEFGPWKSYFGEGTTFATYAECDQVIGELSDGGAYEGCEFAIAYRDDHGEHVAQVLEGPAESEEARYLREREAEEEARHRPFRFARVGLEVLRGLSALTDADEAERELRDLRMLFGDEPDLLAPGPWKLEAQAWRMIDAASKPEQPDDVRLALEQGANAILERLAEVERGE